MKHLLLKISGMTMIFGIGLMLVAPIALMQGSPFDESLQNIQEKLNEQKVEVIDYSSKPWGNLSPEIIDTLKTNGFDSLEAIKKQFEEENLSPQEQVEALEGFDLSNPQANQVYSEMIYVGESQLNSVLLTVVNAFKILIKWLAILIIVISGLHLVMGQEDTAIKEQQRHLIFAVIGLGIILLIEAVINAIFGAPGVTKTVTMFDLEFSDEILGVVAYLKSLLGILAVAMMVLSGVQLAFAFGEEEKMKKQRRAVLWVVVGMVLIMVDKVVVDNIFGSSVNLLPGNPNAPSAITTGNVANVITLLANIAKFALGFMGLAAFGALIYGGALFIANYSDEETVGKAQKIIKSAVIGIVIILSAYAVIATLIGFSP
ncbi:MAG: hypothetical protein V1908_02830 [Candidatus Peregrinibacteria bacterium]